MPDTSDLELAVHTGHPCELPYEDELAKRETGELAHFEATDHLRRFVHSEQLELLQIESSMCR